MVAHASQSRAFTALDWALLAAVATMWGSSFLFIDVGVDHLRPELVALLRLAFGVATLAAIPAARGSPLVMARDRSAWSGWPSRSRSSQSRSNGSTPHSRGC